MRPRFSRRRRAHQEWRDRRLQSNPVDPFAALPGTRALLSGDLPINAPESRALYVNQDLRGYRCCAQPAAAAPLPFARIVGRHVWQTENRRVPNHGHWLHRPLPKSDQWRLRESAWRDGADAERSVTCPRATSPDFSRGCRQLLQFGSSGWCLLTKAGSPWQAKCTSASYEVGDPLFGWRRSVRVVTSNTGKTISALFFAPRFASKASH